MIIYVGYFHYATLVLSYLISSDALFGETENPTGYNTYAYCGNNPVMYSDITGEFALPIPFLPAIAIAVVALLILSMFSDEISQFIDAAIDSLESEIEKSFKKEYTVYALVDDEGEIRYVGRVRTKDYEARMKYHEITKGLYRGYRIDNLNYWECRGIEQLVS